MRLALRSGCRSSPAATEKRSGQRALVAQAGHAAEPVDQRVVDGVVSYFGVG